MTIAKLEIRSLKKSLVIWSLLFIVIVFGFSAIYPQMHETAMKNIIQTSFQSLSPAMLKTFNLQTNGAGSFLVSTGFFAYYFQYMFLAAAIYAMMLGSQALIKEETDGTIEFLYAQPVTRREIIFEKFFANLSVLLVFWLLSFLGSLGSTLLFKQTSDSTNDIVHGISKIFVQEGLVLLFFLALGFLVSALLTSAKQAIGLSLGIVFGFYLIGIFADLSQSFEWAKHLSPIHMAIPANLLKENLSVVVILALLGCSLLFLLVSSICYQRKDLKVI